MNISKNSISAFFGKVKDKTAAGATATKDWLTASVRALPDKLKIMRAKAGTFFKSLPAKLTRKRLLFGAGALVLILLIAAASIYGYYLHRYDRDVKMEQGYADSWEEIGGGTTPAREQSEGEPSAKPEETREDQKKTEGESSLDFLDKINESIIRRRPIDLDVENILLIGIDAANESEDEYNSDTMIVVSFDKKEKTVRAVSLMRDIWTYYPNRGGYDKLNAAFTYGGPGRTVNIINENFDLDIQKYIVTDFEGMRNLVDIMGGIELEITNAESRSIAGISGGGTYSLDGKQALSYARIRKIDSDFSRVQRQRNVIMAMLAEFRSMPPQKQLGSVDKSLKYVRSNIPASQITGDLLDLVRASSSEIKQMTVPEWGYYSVHEDGIWYMSLDWEGQNRSLHNFLYERD